MKREKLKLGKIVSPSKRCKIWKLIIETIKKEINFILNTQKNIRSQVKMSHTLNAWKTLVIRAKSVWSVRTRFGLVHRVQNNSWKLVFIYWPQSGSWAFGSLLVVGRERTNLQTFRVKWEGCSVAMSDGCLWLLGWSGSPQIAGRGSRHWPPTLADPAPGAGDRFQGKFEAVQMLEQQTHARSFSVTSELKKN